MGETPRFVEAAVRRVGERGAEATESCLSIGSGALASGVSYAEVVRVATSMNRWRTGPISFVTDDETSEALLSAFTPRITRSDLSAAPMADALFPRVENSPQFGGKRLVDLE